MFEHYLSDKWNVIPEDNFIVLKKENKMDVNEWTKFFEDVMEDDMFLEFLTREEIAEDMEDDVPCYGIKAIRAHGPAVITFWDDGTRTVSKYNVDEEQHGYNVLVPILLNVLKKALQDREGLYGLLKAIDDSEFDLAAEEMYMTWRIADIIDMDYSGAVELRPTEDGFKVCRIS